MMSPAKNPVVFVVIGLLRTSAGLSGFGFLVSLTTALFRGPMTYSHNRSEYIAQSVFESLAVWSMFAALGLTLFIIGAAPHLFLTQKWLWKVLVIMFFGGCLLTPLFRWLVT